jgi:hypothetical protein
MIADAQAFVFDVDGTLVLSDDPNAGKGGVQVLPGAAEVVRVLSALRESSNRCVQPTFRWRNRRTEKAPVWS